MTVTEQDLLDAIAKEYTDLFPKKGEYTSKMFREEMNSRGLEIDDSRTREMLDGLVKKGRWTVREGRTVQGKSCRIYKPVV
jgi:hypothetical protein